MRYTAWMLAGVIALPFNVALAADGDGIASTAPHPAWARWQGRLSLGVNEAPWRLGADNPAAKLSNASLLGDYYFGESLASPRLLGGFRATSGLIFGSRSRPSAGQPSLASGSAFSIGSHAYGQTVAPFSTDPYADTATQPYLGLGYTGLSVRSGWAFSADLGVLARSYGSSRAALASQTLDDAIRQMRMTPVVQLGASYTF